MPTWGRPFTGDTMSALLAWWRDETIWSASNKEVWDDVDHVPWVLISDLWDITWVSRTEMMSWKDKNKEYSQNRHTPLEVILGAD